MCPKTLGFTAAINPAGNFIRSYNSKCPHAHADTCSGSRGVVSRLARGGALCSSSQESKKRFQHRYKTSPATSGNPESSLSTTRRRYIRHVAADGWPLERIDTETETGEHVPVFCGRHGEIVPAWDGGRPIAFSNPRPRVGGTSRGLRVIQAKGPRPWPSRRCRFAASLDNVVDDVGCPSIPPAFGPCQPRQR